MREGENLVCGLRKREKEGGCLDEKLILLLGERNKKQERHQAAQSNQDRGLHAGSESKTMPAEVILKNGSGFCCH